MKKQIVVLFHGIDPLVKREIIFVTIGATAGVLLG
jgi:hypothetical protein